MKTCRFIAALIVSLLIAGAASAATDASATLRDLCPDRPGKGTSPCTVDAGHVQLEVEIFNGSRQDQDGIVTRSYAIANPTLKFGVTDRLDIEANIAPYLNVTTRDKASGQSDTVSGIGDLFLRAKYAISSDGQPLSVAIEPFLKLPTASHDLGNGSVEGGVLLPVALDLGHGTQLSATPELDVLQNEAGDGTHVGVVNVLGLSQAVGQGVALSAELWEFTDADPSGTAQQYSFDLAGAWQPEGQPNLQFDAGVNFGLNNETPDIQVYCGIARRF